MYKNQLQELAQRSCFNLPSYSCIREGPDHAPRFKATVNFNGETFESPQYCTTLRQAEHSAAEMALNALASRGPSNSLAARILAVVRKKGSYDADNFRMFKNQLQMFAQKSCFSLPKYNFIREGPDHAPRFKAIVNFTGENFESPNFYSTLRQAEHSAAEVALKAFSSCRLSSSLAAKVMDETGVYKNLLQEVSQRVGASLPVYETFRSGLGHLPVFTCTVELAGVIFTGEPAKNKKQAEKNAAMAAWMSLKLMVQQQSEKATPEKVKNDEQEHITVARALQKYLIRARMAKEQFPIRFPTQNTRPPSTVQPPATSSKILPFICHRQARSKPVLSSGNIGSLSSKPTPPSRPVMATINDSAAYPKITQGQQTGAAVNDYLSLLTDNRGKPKFPAAGAAPYIPIRHFSPHHRMAPPVTVRNAIPVFSSPPLPPPSQSPRMMRPPPSSSVVPPVCLRPAVASYCTPPVRMERLSLLDSPIHADESPFSKPPMLPRFEESLGPKVSQAKPENPPSVQTSIGRVEELPPKTSSTLVDMPSSSTIRPNPEASPVQNESPIQKVSVVSPVCSSAP